MRLQVIIYPDVEESFFNRRVPGNPRLCLAGLHDRGGMKKRVWTKPKGHWPRGKPRHQPIAPARLARVRAWFERHRQPAGANERSMAPAATAIGVSDRTLRRWLSGDDNPDPELWRDLIVHLETLGF